ncbi:MAG: arsenate reductase ArsC [Candidatus Eremiobacterota bacterium]
MKKILFVCNENSCRSQMAEGLLNHYGKGKVTADSGGSIPSGIVNPLAIAIMKEKGIDISKETSKGLPEDFSDYDMVITMGCCSVEDLCPVIYSGNKIEWKIDDPKEKDLDFFRRVRNDIEKKVLDLLGSDYK